MCDMAVTHFERLAQKAMDEVSRALLSVPTTDPAVAKLQARHAGLAEAVALHKRSMMSDEDGDIGR